MIPTHPNRTAMTTRTATTRTALSALAALAFAAAPAAAQTIGAPLDPGAGYAGPFGPSVSGGVPTLAQTFQRALVGADWLQSFTIDLGDWNPDASGVGLRFRAAVYTVSGGQLGTQLFLSDERAGSGDYTGFDAYTFATPNLFLDPAVSTFALVLQATGTQNDALNVVAIGDPSQDYAPGALHTADALGNLAPVAGPIDAAFQATFTTSAVPEPATLVLVAGGLVAVAGFARGRRRG